MSVQTGPLVQFTTDGCGTLSLIQAQLPSVPSQPVDQISAEDLPEVPIEDPGGKELLLSSPWAPLTV